jgi:hypothetical protein
VEPQSGLRGFVQKPVGRALFIAFAILATAFTYSYISPLIAIPVVILVGFAFPIWLGLKRLRFLALLGLVILLIAAPVANVVLTQDVLVPIGPAASPTDLPGGGGGAVMQNAAVSPFVGTTSTVFTWNVTIVPAYIPKGNDTPYLLQLYLSTCPGATSTNDPNCGAGYPFYILNQTFAADAFTNKTSVVVSFSYQFTTDSIWAWQMGLFLNNSSSPATHNATFILLVGDPTYNGLEGPVVGTFATTYEQLLLTVYLNVFVYLGIPYYVVLLLYMVIKRRQFQQGSALARSAGPVPPESGPSNAPVTPAAETTASASPSVARRPEVPCPNCGAVVYPNETTCWKCGAKLGGGGTAGAPLPSAPGSPPKA